MTRTSQDHRVPSPLRDEPPQFFMALQARARDRWNQLEADPDLAGPWRQLFTQVQSPRHVLCELLQNADDAGATWAAARIEDGTFCFEHDGKDFDEDDFRSLCRFGFSNKRNLHTIGFRGVGFKSTFSLGGNVEVFTPTLAIRFNRDRFTEPIWIGRRQSTNVTAVKVRIEDPNREREPRKNLREWSASPASLLFFNHIENLEIESKTIGRRLLSEGPVSNSEWTMLSGQRDQKVLVVHSNEEELPPEALEEIRKERFSEEVELPPCGVELVLGLSGEQRLFVVLPTDVRINMPFSCNAPFIQDPARSAIKDPSISPTNRWLLSRLGRLAANALSTWIGDNDLRSSERARAYELVPPVVQEDNEGIQAESISEICEAFAAVLEDKPILLTTKGEVVPPNTCLALPTEIHSVWNDDVLLDLFGRGRKTAVLSPDIIEAHRQRLEEWGWLEPTGAREVVDRLSLGLRPPKPESWSCLLALWTFMENAITNDRRGEKRREVAMVPVSGAQRLFPASEVVRLAAGRKSLKPEDWNHLSEYILALDDGWQKLLAEDQRIGDPSVGDRHIRSAAETLEAIGLAGPTPLDQVVAKASTKFFGRDKIQKDECLRFAHIVAALNAGVPESFKYVTQDDVLTAPSDGVVYDRDGGLAGLLPEKWAKEHLLHEAYEQESPSCTPSQWRDWAASDKSGLRLSPPIEPQEKRLWDRRALINFLEGRNVKAPESYHYSRPDFAITDYDFNKDLVDQWLAIAKDDDTIWSRILRRILMGPISEWQSYLLAGARECGYRYSHKLQCGDIPSAWIARFRDQACLHDTYARPREPAELLMRTPHTEPLMGVEDFVDADLDTHDTKPLLRLLGVRDKPTDPTSLLNRIRSLADVVPPPLHELAKWYDALDRLLVRCESSDIAKIRQAFQDERLIYTEQGEWTTSGEVFQLAADDFPDAPVVHSSVAGLSLWDRLGVANRPSAGLIIDWLQGLDSGAKLDGQLLTRVRAYLQQYPGRIWEECGHWLTLDGAWTPVDELDLKLLKGTSVRVRALFSTVKHRSADLRSLRFESTKLPAFAELEDLGQKLDYRVTEKQTDLPKPIEKPWLAALGQCLRRLKLDDDDQTLLVYAAALRLARTKWQPFTVLRVTPYLDGSPAGQPHSPDVLWEGHTLYVENRSVALLIDAVVEELGRHFGNERILDAIRVCAERDEGFVTEYMEQRFDLEDAPLFEEPEDDTGSSDVDGKGPKTSPDEELFGDVITVGEPDGEDTDAGDEDEHEDQAIEELDEVKWPEGEEEDETEPKEPRGRRKQALIDRFAQAEGFRWDPTRAAYVHRNGSTIRKTEGLFPWERCNGVGDAEMRYWASEHKLSQGLDIGADLWELLQSNPGQCSLILLADDGTPTSMTGMELQEMVEAEILGVFPAKYRLRMVMG